MDIRNISCIYLPGMAVNLMPVRQGAELDRVHLSSARRNLPSYGPAPLWNLRSRRCAGDPWGVRVCGHMLHTNSNVTSSTPTRKPPLFVK